MGGLDNYWNKILSETIRKENRAADNHPSNKNRVPKAAAITGDAAVFACFTGALPTAATTPRLPVETKRSAAMRFLEEKTGLCPVATEYAEAIQAGAAERPSTGEFLYHGISAEGHGRCKYLKERKKYGVIERHRMPLTASHDYGMIDPKLVGRQDPSMHCRKPIIQHSFFRTMGVATYRDLPGGYKVKGLGAQASKAQQAAGERARPHNTSPKCRG
mmetsp:Transcript_24556/g.70046  ORF Transcript_24556/g.70046 Transcript_24556/m.70046 type:complete len:217 (+) Transcript_24556:112-762(+)